MYYWSNILNPFFKNGLLNQILGSGLSCMAILAHVTLIRDNCSIVRVLLTYYTAVNYCAKYFINSALVKEQYNIALLSVVENFTRINTMEV